VPLAKMFFNQVICMCVVIFCILFVPHQDETLGIRGFLSSSHDDATVATLMLGVLWWARVCSDIKT
jgi:hypothetical protein